MVLSTCSTMLHAVPVSLLRLQFKKLFHSRCLGASDTELIVTCRHRHIICLNLVVDCELLMIYVFFSLLFQAIGIEGDVRKQEDAKRVVELTFQHFGRLDILVNAAAGNFLAPAEDLSPNGFRTGWMR